MSVVEIRMSEPTSSSRVAHAFLLVEDAERRLHAVVIVKAWYTLVPDALAEPAPPLAPSDDAHGDGTHARSLIAASDFAPAKVEADVVVVGSAHPHGAAITRQVVGFALARGPDVLLRKRLVAVGDRARDGAEPSPLRPLPLAWERTWGGPENPVGVGLSGAGAHPTFVDPDALRRPAGLGPIAPTWPGRARFLAPGHERIIRELTRACAGGDGTPAPTPLALPPDLDLRFFQIAPPDQRIDRVRGGEQLLLVGLHPTHPSSVHRLPALHAFARIEAPARPARNVPLVGDTLWIDAERGLVSVTFRGTILLATPDEAPALLRDRRPWRIHTGMAPAANAEETSGAPEGWRKPRARASSREPLDAPDRVALPPSPTVDALPIHDLSGFTVGTRVWSFDPPKRRRLVVVKATYAIDPDGAAPHLAATQDLLRGDEAEGDDPDAELRYPSDHAPFKPKTDVLLVGTAHAPAGHTTALVRFSLGAVERRLVALGPRTWGANGIPSPPGPFEPVPLRWGHAFGGPGFVANPRGTGLAPGSPPPRLEDPDHLIRGRNDRPSPACFAPVSPAWPARGALLGTYDRTWKRERWPYFPADFDPAFFQAAPAALQREEPRGAEAFLITSVRPGGADLRGRLPEARPRAFAARPDGSLFEVLLRLDTLLFDADAAQLRLTFRGSFDIDDGDASRLIVLREEREGEITLADVAVQVAALAELRLAPMATRPATERATPAPSGAFHLQVRLGEPPAALVFAARAIAAPRPAPPPALERAGVERLLRAGKGLRGLDLSGADLRDMDLCKRDVRGAILAGANLAGTNLAGADLTGANLAGARADGARWDDATLTGADLTGAHLTGARLSRAALERASLAGAILTDAHLDDVRAAGADLVGADLTRCHADGADLRKVDLSRATLTAASLRKARLDDAKLYEVMAVGACLDEASLVDARFERAKLSESSLRGVSAAGAVWERADLAEASLASADLTGAVFAGSLLLRADLGGALARKASFRGADLTGAKLDGADLMQASFEEAILRGASLRGASLYQAETLLADFAGAELRGANVAGTKLARG
jgi:uncharacterized protein YjbI with pentapeptide repeats